MTGGICWQWQFDPSLDGYRWVKVFNWFNVVRNVDCRAERDLLLARGFTRLNTNEYPPEPPPIA